MQVSAVKQQIRVVEEDMEKVMKKFVVEMHSLNNMMVL